MKGKSQFEQAALRLRKHWEAIGSPPLRTVCEVAVGPESVLALFENQSLRALFIEPDPSMAASARARYPWAEVLEVAISDAQGEAVLTRMDGWSYLLGVQWAPAMDFLPDHLKGKGSVNVKTISFDQVDDGCIDLLNLDCEGSEWHVLKNMKSRPLLIHVEICKNNAHRPEIFEWFKVNGYKDTNVVGDWNHLYRRQDVPALEGDQEFTDHRANLLREIWQSRGALPLRTIVDCGAGEKSMLEDFMADAVRTVLIEGNPVFSSRLRVDYPGAEVCPFGVLGTHRSEAKLRRLGDLSYLTGIPWTPAFDICWKRAANAPKAVIHTRPMSDLDDGRIDLLAIDLNGGEWWALMTLRSRPALMLLKRHAKNHFNAEIDQWLEMNGYAESAKDSDGGVVYFREATQPASEKSSVEVIETRRAAVSFSMYGHAAEFTAGIVQNLEACAQIYPGWDVVVHTDKGHFLVPKLRQMGALVVEHDDRRKHTGTCWRFLTCDMESRYDYFISRDADSRVNPREKAAVDEWLASGRSTHVMLEAPHHRKSMLAGMFGMKTGTVPFGQIIRDWGSKGRFGDDERMLNSVVWPLVKDDAIVHTSHPPASHQLPFPVHPPWSGSVGQREPLLLPRDSTRLILLSPERYHKRREKFLQSMRQYGGFLNQLDLTWFEATPFDQKFCPPSFKHLRKVKHWWAASCDHMTIMEQALVSGCQHLFVFEDDVLFHPQFHELFWQAWAGLPVNWKAMRLSWKAKWNNNPPVHPGILNRCDTRGHLMAGTFWSRKGLYRAYDHFWHRRSLIIDGAFEDLRAAEPDDWYQPATMIAPCDAGARQRGNDK